MDQGIQLVKVQDFEELKENTSSEFSQKELQINQLETNKANKTELENLNNSKADKTELVSALSTKRNISDKIKNTDLDISNDSNKIKLINLADEVQQALTGNAPALTTLADGIVTNTKLADGATDRSKLSEKFSVGNDISASSDLKTIFKEGIFTGISNGNYINAPENYNTNQPFILEVKPAFNSGNRWWVLEMTEMFSPFRKWITLVDRTNQFTYPWSLNDLTDNSVSTAKLIDNSVTSNKIANNGVTNNKLADGSVSSTKLANNAVVRTKLSDDFMVNYAYISATGNVNTAILQGNYVVLAGALNAPITNTTFTLNTEIYRTNTGAFYWITQTATTTDGVARQFVRKMYTQFNNWSEWAEVTNNNSRFSGKTIVVIGDSIVENYNYTSKLGTLLGANIISVGFGGCRMSRYGTDPLGSLYTEMCMARLSDYIKTGNYTGLEQAAQSLFELNGDDNRAQVARLKAVNWNNVHSIIVAFGTNDYGGNIPIGEDTDNTSDTFKGAINLSIENIASSRKNVQLLFMTPFWRGNYTGVDNTDSDTYANPLGFKLIDYVDATIKRCNANHYPVYDAYRNMGINRFNQDYYLVDRLHPNNTVGTDLIANKYFGFINSAI